MCVDFLICTVVFGMGSLQLISLYLKGVVYSIQADRPREHSLNIDNGEETRKIGGVTGNNDRNSGH